ncbi:MAG: 2-oxoglutarate dehydrogenase complex dihydrolipoyllysine-residue succinyltransferase [Deferrisomatales bacterium]
MSVEVKVPEVGESVREALLAEWFKSDGDAVAKDEPLFLLETDKVTLEVPAETDGVLRVLTPAGATVAIGEVVGRIEPGAQAAAGAPPAAPSREAPAAAPEGAAEEAPDQVPPEAAAPPIEPEPPGEVEKEIPAAERAAPPAEGAAERLAPSVRRLVRETGVDLAEVVGTGPGGRVTKGDVLLHLEGRAAPAPERPRPEEPEEAVTRTPVSPIRRRIAERLLEATRSTAMLTTFNEIDMSRVKALRARYREAFREKHGVGLGYTSFFVKAAVDALRAFPAVNAFLEGEELVYHHYYHVGIAVGGERGLVVPVIRHADRRSFAEIEQAIDGYVDKVRTHRLELSDLEGGTFTITNGGVFGSLLSTPILNFPQTGILGLHKIEDRPVVVDGRIEVRPMMYVALSYDHRVVDGREAVQFLVRVKEVIEDPERLLVEV